jgi:hypothetical protein
MIWAPNGQPTVQYRLFVLGGDQSRSTVRYRRRVYRSDCPRLEGGLEVRYLLRPCILQGSSALTTVLPLARDKFHLAISSAAPDCALRARERRQRIIVLNGAGKLSMSQSSANVPIGRPLSYASSRPSREHMVDHLCVAKAGSATHLGRDIGAFVVLSMHPRPSHWYTPMQFGQGVIAAFIPDRTSC